MAMWLKQSTASQEVLLGPFMDEEDGITPLTGLTIANTDVKLFKAGATSEADKNSGGGTHIAAGRYYVVLDATDTDTLGLLEINVHATGALPVRREFMVLSANVYDSLVLGSDNLQVDATQIEGSDATNQIRDAVVDDATRIDASALNTLSSHDPGEAIMGATDLGTGAALTTLATQASVNTIDDFLDTEIAAILAAVDTEVAALLVAVAALPTAAANAAALMDLANGIETSVTPRQALRLMLAAAAGKLSGAATTTVTIRNVGDSKDRITATVDADGNRSAVTVDAT